MAFQTVSEYKFASDMLVVENRARGYLFTATTAICFAINGIGIRYIYNIYPELTPENGIFWGFVGSLLLVLPYYLFVGTAQRRLILSFKRDWRVIFGVSVLTSTGAILWFFAMKHAEVGIVSLLAKTMIVHTALLGLFFLKEKFSMIELAGFVLVLPGVYFISNVQSSATPQAVAAVLISAFFYALQSLVVKKYAPRLHGMDFTYLRAVFMLALIGIVLLALGRIDKISISLVFLLGITGVSGLIIGRAFYFEAHKYLEISRLNTAMLVEPLFVLLAAYWLIAEALDFKKLTGALFILTGLWLIIQRSVRKKPI